MTERNDEQDRKDEQMLTRLLNLADEGPQIPQGNIDGARKSLRQVWLEMVRIRRRRRIGWTVGAVAAVVLLVIGLTSMMGRSTTGTSIVAHVEAISGEAWMRTAGGQRVRLTENSEIQEDATLTSAARARVALRLATGHGIRIDHSTILDFQDADSLRLHHGAVYVDSGLIRSNGIRVTTPLGEARDVGTRFLVRYEDEELRVLVRSGTVLVGLANQAVRIDQGGGVVVSADSEPERLAITPYASEWDWARQVAPPFDVTGRTVDAFLKWYENETGRTVHYTDPESERLARQATIYGDVVDGAPELAMESILLSAGLEGTVRDGHLMVRSIDRRSSSSQ